MKAQDVLNFWFVESKREDWFKKNLNFDEIIKQRFGETLRAAAAGELSEWRNSPQGRLAEIIVLDQFSRNVYRDTATSFAQDKMALVLAQEMVHFGLDQSFSHLEKSFIYLPYMHSESLLIHEVAKKLFAIPGLEENYDYELKHSKVLERFGRFPYRNVLLSRESTPEEVSYLKEPGSAF